MVQVTVVADTSTNAEKSNDQAVGNDIEKDKISTRSYTLEEAIQETRTGKCQYILTFLTGMSVLGSAIENTNISYILPYAKCDLKLTTQEQGLLSAISYLGIVFTSHLWGFLADTWGRQKVLRVAAIGGFIFSFSSAFATDTISMILLRFLAGAFVAGASSGGYTYIAEFFHTPASAARAAAFVSISLSGVWLIMSPVALAIIPMDWRFYIFTLEYKPWRFFLTCTSTINLFNAIVFSFMPETPKFLLAMNRKEEVLKVLSRMYAINTGEFKEKYPVKSIESVTLGNNLADTKGVCGFLNLVVKQTKPVFQKPLFTNTWKLCYIIFVMFSIGHGTFMWFPDFLMQLQRYEGIPKTLCEIVGPKNVTNSMEQACNIDNKNLLPFQLLFVVGICFVTLSSVSSFYLKKIEPKKLVCGWLLLSMTTCALLNYLTDFYAIVISFVLFLSCNVCANIVMAVAVNLFPTNYRAMATAFIMMCGRIGGVSGSSIVGFLLNGNCPLIFYLFSGILISCALVFMMIKIKS